MTMDAWRRRARVAALGAWVTAALFMALSALALFGQDFRDFYAAARLRAAGGDVYDAHQLAAEMRAASGFARYNPFYYPPWFPVLLTPLARLPYGAARAVWMILNGLAWVFGLWALTRLSDWPPADGPGAWGWGGRWGVYLLATFLFAWVTWRYEQLGVWLFALLAGGLWAIRARRAWLAGIGLALMLTKPTVSLVVVGALLFWLARRKEWGALAAFGLSLACLAALAAPDWPRYLARLRDPEFSRGLQYVLTADGGIAEFRINTTLRDWLTGFGLPAAAHTWVYGFSLAVAAPLLGWIAWRSPSPLTVAAAAVAAGFWLAPYALQYDFPPLTVALWAGLRGLERLRGWRRWVGWALLAGVVSVLFWERPISDGFWMVVGLAALLAWTSARGGRETV